MGLPSIHRNSHPNLCPENLLKPPGNTSGTSLKFVAFLEGSLLICRTFENWYFLGSHCTGPKLNPSTVNSAGDTLYWESVVQLNTEGAFYLDLIHVDTVSGHVVTGKRHFWGYHCPGAQDQPKQPQLWCTYLSLGGMLSI